MRVRNTGTLRASSTSLAARCSSTPYRYVVIDSRSAARRDVQHVKHAQDCSKSSTVILVTHGCDISLITNVVISNAQPLIMSNYVKLRTCMCAQEYCVLLMFCMCLIKAPAIEAVSLLCNAGKGHWSLEQTTCPPSLCSRTSSLRRLQRRTLL